MKIGRFVRTVGGLEKSQLVWFPVRRATTKGLAPFLSNPSFRKGDPSRVFPSEIRTDPELREIARGVLVREKERYLARIHHLSPKLAAFEASYGLQLGDSAEELKRVWTSPVAFTPYCASVRARQLALAVVFHGKETPASLYRELQRAGRAVAVQLERDIGGNHLFENAMGLLSASAWLQGKEAERWGRVGRDLLLRLIFRHFLSDGGHYERSATYHAHCLHALLVLRLIRQAAQQPPLEGIEPGIANGLTFLQRVRAPDGTPPLFNDASLDAAPTIDEIFAFANALGIAHSEAKFKSLDVLDETGWAILRNARAHVFFDAGADGARDQPGHVHADALTFELFVDNERAIVDYGVDTYEDNEHRAYARGTAAHNTVQVGKRNSAEVWSAFRTGAFSKAKLVSFATTGDRVSVSASHTGFGSSPFGLARVGSGHAPLKVLRHLELSKHSLRIVDEVPATKEVVTSRLRVREGAGIECTGSHPVTKKAHRWYPRFGVASPATIFELTRAPNDPAPLCWEIRW